MELCSVVSEKRNLPDMTDNLVPPSLIDYSV